MGIPVFREAASRRPATKLALQTPGCHWLVFASCRTLSAQTAVLRQIIAIRNATNIQICEAVTVRRVLNAGKAWMGAGFTGPFGYWIYWEPLPWKTANFHALACNLLTRTLTRMWLILSTRSNETYTAVICGEPRQTRYGQICGTTKDARRTPHKSPDTRQRALRDGTGLGVLAYPYPLHCA